MDASPLPPTRRLLHAAAWLIPAGVLINVGVALLTTDAHFLEDIGRVTPLAVCVAVGLALLPWATQSLRIGIWTRFVGHPVGFRSGVRIAAGGVLGSAVTPTAVGGGTIRWALATRYGVPPGKAASLLAVEAVEDLTFFALALPAAILLSHADESAAIRRLATSPARGLDDPVWATAAGVVAVGVLLGVVARLALRGRFGPGWRRRGVRLAARVRRPFRALLADVRLVLGLVATSGKRWFALSLSLTAVQWITRYSLATIVIVLLGGPLRPYLFWVLSWATYAVSSAVPTPGAAGAAEATFYVLHTPFVSAERLVVVTAAWRLLMFYVPALVAAVTFPMLGAAERRRAARAAAAGGEALAPPRTSTPSKG
ncbi:lysylphosphatidylglycerol synthase transmembrane domain-containing protein [Rubrivirga sp. IMCC43871]|uniref:lysylphosphatidylglycerol synthase transmembrane domain-containing protein n=1 Tax=Rubrivirga sp. IMCC43871 TaxID=3391575 RepID=UPI00399025F1